MTAQELERACLYLIMPALPGGSPVERFLPPVLEAGVDIVQLREKTMHDSEMLDFAHRVRRLTKEAGALFIVNDRVDVAVACKADGVHLGQDDMTPRQARKQLGDGAVIGLSTHDPEQVLAGQSWGADYLGVGPVFSTPTKPGRPAVGTGLVSYAAENSNLPFFAIGGIDESCLADVVKAGATRVSVLRAIVDAVDPAGATARLKAGLISGVTLRPGNPR